MSKRLVHWRERYPSSVSKEVLIKYVAQAIPTYVMSVFKLSFLVDDLSRLMRQYWWGVGNDKKKMALMAWDKLVLPKFKGGMATKLCLLNRLSNSSLH